MRKLNIIHFKRKEFEENLEKRLYEDEIRLINVMYKENGIEIEFELNSLEDEDWTSYQRERVVVSFLRSINKYSDLYCELEEDLVYFEKNRENKLFFNIF